jgi:membrane protein DedA with SNARE-associated domain
VCCETSGVTGFIRDYGLIIVFVTIGLETSGLPLPGETALVAAAVLASRGHFSIEWVIVVAAIAAILGDNLGYWLGRKLGRGFLQRYGPVRRFSERILPPTERFFERHGGKSIFLARWFSGFRIAGAWIAGFAHMSWWRFFFWNALGGIVWAVTVGLLGYYGGEAAGDAIDRYGLIGGGLLAVLAIVVIGGLHLWRRRVVEQS